LSITSLNRAASFILLLFPAAGFSVRLWQRKTKPRPRLSVLIWSLTLCVRGVGWAKCILTKPIAGDIGMDADLVSELLKSDRDETAVQEEILFYRNLGVSGVPTFIYNGQFAVQGAQPASAHVQAIKQAASLPAPE